jgi:hypothetical protein
MPRYVTRPKARGWIEDPRYDDDKPLIPGCDVPEHVATFTGLLDASGEEIWIEPRSIGFHAEID